MASTQHCFGDVHATQPLAESRDPASAAPTRRHRLRSSATTIAKPANDDPVHLAQMLSSRICHDLIGPIGIAAATDDLRDADHRIDEEALALVAESARTAAARLAFFRFAFGFGQRSDGLTSGTSLASLLDGALAGNRLRIEWRQPRHGRPAAESPIPVPAARLLLCLALIATEALPRGGTMSVGFTYGDDDLEIRVRAAGVGARVPAASFEAYLADSCANLTPRTVVGYYAGQLAAGLNASINVGGEPGECIEITLKIPGLGRLGCVGSIA